MASENCLSHFDLSTALNSSSGDMVLKAECLHELLPFGPRHSAGIVFDVLAGKHPSDDREAFGR